MEIRRFRPRCWLQSFSRIGLLIGVSLFIHSGPASAQLPGIITGPVINPANGHEYYLLQPASWTNAESAAVALGGHLVTINNPDENAWVYGTFGSYGGVGRDLWIGLFDPDPSVKYLNPETEAAKFLWISGQIAPVNPWQWGSMGPASGDWKSLGHIKIAGPQTPLDWDRGRWLDDYATTELNSVVELSPTLEIVSQPRAVSVGIGGTATFVVVAEGPQPISYQWQFSGTNMPGATGSTLTLTNLMPPQSGQYSVVVSNPQSAITSDPAMLAVAGIVPWGTYPLPDPRTVVPSGLESVLAISAGWYHDLALKPDGTVACWGDNTQGQLSVPPDLTNVIAISGGEYHSLALKADGTVIVWGSMAQPPASVTNVVAIDAGYEHSLALKADGTVVGWGGVYGCSGAALGGLTNCVAISAGYGHDLALAADRTVVDLSPRAGENPVPLDLTNVVAVSAGQTASLALKADGTVVGWPTEISDFFFLALNIPSDLTNVVAISAKANHSMALLADGNVVAWGTNWWGESTVPPSLPNTVAIAGGFNHSLALLRDGTPSLTVQPWDQQVRRGDNLVFAVRAVGVQPIEYQWQFEGTNIPGATGESYAIVQAQPQNAGAYAVVVSNAVGRVSSRRNKLSVLPTASDRPSLVVKSIAGQGDGPFQLTVGASLNCKLAIQSSSDLQHWSTLTTLTNSAGEVSFTDFDQRGAIQFYRVQVVP